MKVDKMCYYCKLSGKEYEEKKYIQFQFVDYFPAD